MNFINFAFLIRIYQNHTIDHDICQAYCYIVLYVTYVLQHSEIYKTKRLVGTINIECVLRKVSLLCFDFY